jgi:hypothetical protein
LFLIPGRIGAAEQWYRSNAAGMTLERVASRFAALRNKYCLSVGIVSSQELPEYLREYYNPAYQIERHTLYEEGKESRQQWIFRDQRGVTRLVSSLSKPTEEEAPEETDTPSKAESVAADNSEKDASVQEPPSDPQESLAGFIEIYDENNLITEEHQFSSKGEESITTYFYNRQVLIRAETRVKTPILPPELESEEKEGEEKRPEPVKPAFTLITTDTYRYSRSNSLRAVERVYHAAVSSDNSEEPSSTRLQFPHLGLKSRVEDQFVTPGTPYSSEFLQDVILDSDTKPGDQVVYTTDDRGKIVTETRRDADGEIRGEIRNTWAGDRLEAIDWKSGEDKRRTEYEYDSAGDQIMERNYNKGVLERTVRRENGQEIEELYMNGMVVLRAIWENGRKISEERVPRKN